MFTSIQDVKIWVFQFLAWCTRPYFSSSWHLQLPKFHHKLYCMQLTPHGAILIVTPTPYLIPSTTQLDATTRCEPTMPRAKVDPKNRQRADKACLACRLSKKRCSGTFPCIKCVRAGRGDACAASVQLQTPSPWLSSARVRNATAILDSDVHDAVTTPRLRCATPPLQSPIHPSDHPGSLSPEAPHRTHPRMLRNLQGERGKIDLSFVRGMDTTCSLC